MEDFEQRFLRAQEGTSLHRTRQNDLYTFGSTRLPYVFLGSSAINAGDTVIRRGEIRTEKPTLFLGGNPQSEFEGFEEEGDDPSTPMLFARAFQMSGLNVHNDGMTLEVVEREVRSVVDGTLEEMDRQGDRRTAVVEGPEDLWALSLLIYAGEMTQRSAPGNVKDLLERNQQIGFE